MTNTTITGDFLGLANAVIEQAALDYRNAIATRDHAERTLADPKATRTRKISAKSFVTRANKKLDHIESFLTSDTGYLYSNGTGSIIVKRLRSERYPT